MGMAIGERYRRMPVWDLIVFNFLLFVIYIFMVFCGLYVILFAKNQVFMSLFKLRRTAKVRKELPSSMD